MVSGRRANKRVVSQDSPQISAAKGDKETSVNGAEDAGKTQDVAVTNLAADSKSDSAAAVAAKRGRKPRSTTSTAAVVKDEITASDNESSTSAVSNGKRGRSSRAAAIKANAHMNVKEEEDEQDEPPKKMPKNKKVKVELDDDNNIASTSTANATKAKSVKSTKGKTAKSTKGKTAKSKREEKPEPPKKSAVERKVVKKGRAAVDAQCSIAASSHVLEEDDDIWDCLLNQTNIQFNNNKYYIIQLLEDDRGGVYSVWMRWGRVGANGQNCLKPFGTNLNQAKKIFSKKFSDKTCNDWEDRDEFEKEPGKYDLLHIDYSHDSESVVEAPPDQIDGKKKEKKEIVSKLEEGVLKLVQLICNIKIMVDAVVEMKYDAEKSPLGKLTKGQIKAGYLALVDISNIVNQGSGKVDNKALLQACNNFYTRIPHYFGMKVPPMIRSPSEVREKLLLLEALADIQAAMTFLNSEDLDDGLHPADRHYAGLQCDIKMVPQSDDAFKLISKYVALNHGRTHSSYKLQVVNVYECVKSSEQARFMTSVGNRMLLWHGSRLSNWAGILSQGLRIAPPEAPVTGYMFGKGIYFADMCSKSANYCMANSTNNTGLLTLCEVALGTSVDHLQADYRADQLPAGCHSAKGVGGIAPQQNNFVTMSDGVVVPLGPAKDKKTSSSLLYNEFIVYNPAQVRLRYLVKVEFNFAY